MNGWFLLDEHLYPWWRTAIRRRQPGLTVFHVGDPGAPPLQSPDPLLLEWCEANQCLLITNNRKSMPSHLADHLARGRHMPGILTVNLGIRIGMLANELALIAGAGLPDDFQDQIRHLPL